MKLKTLLTTMLSYLISWFLMTFGTMGYACPFPLSKIDANIKGIQLTLELASTPETRECGLSKRSILSENSGMLFVLPKPQPFTLWMKDTELPLSVAFLDNEGRILSINKMSPFTTDTIYRSPQPVRFALEVNQGWFTAHNIHVGDVLNFSLPKDLYIE